MKKKKKRNTILSHDDQSYSDYKGAIVPPIFQNSLFAFESWDAIDDAFADPSSSYIYSRLLNPTALIVEDKIAQIAGGEKAKLYASGMGAISAAILHCVKAGDHIVTIKNIYGPANSFISKYLVEKCGISVSYITGKDPKEFKTAIKKNTTLFYLESPASLTYQMQDLKAVAKIAKKHGIKTVIDNTWASPIFQRPLELGIDISVHSASKYLCGHSDVIAGVVIANAEIMDAMLMKEHALLGAKIAPFEAWLILRSLRTLPMRMQQTQVNTWNLIQILKHHPSIKSIIYPRLKSFDQYELGKKQMDGYGGLFSIILDTTDLKKIKKFVNTLKLFKLGVSWGGHESLVYAPVISYARELTPNQFDAMGIIPGLIRLSIGFEDTEDLADDLFRALKKI